MSLPKIVSREQWLEARKALLDEEKALTRRRDALNVARRELPMVAIDKDYAFNGPDGEASLLDLFEGRSQLIVGHFMFHPDWQDGCPSCTAGAKEVSDGLMEHLATRDTTLAFVSRAPLDKLERWKAKQGFRFAWYSSGGSDFNYDFGVTIDQSRGAATYNYRDAAGWEAAGQPGFFDVAQPFEMPGTSCFLRADERAFHTYSSYARGAEWTGGSYAYLDLTALGRQEDWEEPKGRTSSVRAAQPDFAS